MFLPNQTIKDSFFSKKFILIVHQFNYKKISPFYEGLL